MPRKKQANTKGKAEELAHSLSETDQQKNTESEKSDNNAQTQAEEITKLNAEIASLKDQLLRSLAETENVRRRLQRELEDTSKYAITGFARELIDVLENLYRTKENISEDSINTNEQIKNISEGIKLTQAELLKSFEKNGIKRIYPIGENFNHNYHQAIVQIESHTAKPGEIVQVIQAGYIIHDRLLRPAMVGVAKAPSQTN